MAWAGRVEFKKFVYTILYGNFNALKKDDFEIAKIIPTLSLKVEDTSYTIFMKNSTEKGNDYGTIINDFTNGVKTEIKIQYGKMFIDGKEIATK